MATSEKILIHQKGTSRLKYNNDPVETPYSSFSSFKSIDNTVVSAYEVGATNGVSGKSLHNPETGQQVVSKNHKSLARKPPSGVRHEYKPLGTSSKSKSLSDIHIVHNKGNKIPEVSVNRFDNRLLRHNVKHSEKIVPTLQSIEVDLLLKCSKNNEKKREVSVNTYGEIENKDVQPVSTLCSSDNSLQSDTSKIKLDRTRLDLCDTSCDHSKLQLDKGSTNKNEKDLQYTFSLDNSSKLQKSSLVHVDSGNILRSRLNHDGSRGHSHRKHLSVRKSSKTENVDTFVKESELSSFNVTEIDISIPGVSSLASRRKLPKVPGRLKEPVAGLSNMADSLQQKSECDKKDFVSESSGLDVNILGVQSKPLLSSFENPAFMTESDSGKFDTSSGSNDCTGCDLIETMQVNMHKNELSGSFISSDEKLSSQVSHSFPSQTEQLVDQEIDKKTENVKTMKSELKSKQAGKDIQPGQVSEKKSESSNLEDRFRKKLKEIVSSSSNKPINLPHYNDSIVNIKPDNTHKKCLHHVSDTGIDSAEVLKDETSPVLHSAKGGSKNKESNSVNSRKNVYLETDIPPCFIFNFNQEVIQELTDLVMIKPESRDQCQTPDVSETQGFLSETKDLVTLNTSDISVWTETKDLSQDSNQNQLTEKAKDLTEVGDDSDLNQSLKDNIEGKSFDGKSDITSDCDDKDGARKEAVHPAGEEIKAIQEKGQKDFAQKQGHVVRTPSYRKRVMARAKLRYSKKSQNFKECSCTRNENGTLKKCLFCQKFEIKKRSQTILGHPALGDYSDSECSEIASPRRALTPELSGGPSGQGHKSPRSLRKVNVSPRVDILLSSSLFKKHLQKHENLIQKHTMSYKRFGMNKSVSNLDLSEGFTADTDTSYQDNTSEISEPASERDFIDAASNNSTDTWASSELSATNRRHSLTGETEIQFSDYNCKTRMSKKSGDTLPSSFTKPRSRPGIGSLFDNVRNRTQSRNYIPSFHEFKKQKELGSTEIENDQDLLCKPDAKKIQTIDVSEDIIVVDDNKEKVENDLQTVLETDKRGSKENLISAKTVENVIKLKPDTDNQQSTSSHTVETNLSTSDVLTTHVDTNQNDDLASKAQTRLKGKTRTLPSIDLSILSDNSSDQSTREKRRITTKRPRSLISKKLTSQDSDTPDTSNKDLVMSTNVSARPKLKGHHSRRIIRSESDSKYETEKGKNPEETVEERSKGAHSRHLSLLGKGHNSVSFNLESVKNDGTSDISSSMTESNLSDSIYSEVCVNETITSVQDADDVVDNLSNDTSAGLKDELAASVLRSTSDACEITQEAARKRRERKERPYKSDPFAGTEIIPATKRCALREEKARLREHLSFATSSKEEILSFLDGVNQSDLAHGESFPSLEELSEDEQKSIFDSHISDEYMRKLGKHPSNVSSLSTDSGVIGQDESHDSKQSSPSNTLTHSMSEHRPLWHQAQTVNRRVLSASCSDLSENIVCNDCSDDTIHQNMSFLCAQCVQRRIERKKIIQEVVDTELNYGRDLKILQEEFYKPMLKAGLLTKDQLDCIFLNLDELIHVNVHFITKLKAAINHSNQNEDEDLREVMIGSLFLESSTMFLTFENYCVNQAQAPILLEQLEREKELLRIFLHVSQSDNHLLRRMHLKSFLMVPVQRIMKYPLLLDRLYKVTLDTHRDKEALREAKEKIEDILGHINAKSKFTNVKQRKGSEKHYSVTEKIEVSRVALETLGWNRKDVCDVITTRLHITQPLDHMWAVKKCKNHKFTTVHGVLLSLVQQNYSSKDNEQVSSNTILNASINNNNNNNIKNNSNNNITNAINNGLQVQSAAVVLIKEKNGRYQVAREPFMLDKCVVSQDPDFMEVFELLEWNRESYLIKAENPLETKTWVLHLRRQMQNLGCWRKRRNALPNILLNHLS